MKMKMTHEGFPAEALEKLAEVSRDVLHHKQTFSDDIIHHKEEPVQDLAQVLKFPPLDFHFPTKRRGARPRKIKEEPPVDLVADTRKISALMIPRKMMKKKTTCTRHRKTTQKKFPVEALDMLAQICCDVLHHKLNVPDDEPHIKGKPRVFYIPTKTRATRKRKVIMIRRLTANHDLPHLSVLPPKKRRHWDILHEDNDVQSEDTKTEVKKNTSTAKRRKKNYSDKKGIMVGPNPAPAMPSELMDKVVQDFDGSMIQFAIQKSLFATDLKKVENRLSMPLNQINSNDFLTEEEKRTLARRKQDNRLVGIEVDFVMPDLSKTKLMLRKWDLKTSSSYALTGNWYEVAKDKLVVDDVVQVWFFRSREGKPCFALVNLGQEGASSAASASVSSHLERSGSEPKSDVSCLTDQVL